MSRRVYLLGLGLALVALALAVTDWALMERTPPPRPGLTEANAQRIRLGMTQEEVSAVLGQPPSAIHGTMIEGEWGKCWGRPGGVAVVMFGSDGRVKRAYWTNEFGRGDHRLLTNPQPDPRLLGRLRAWLGW